MASSLGSVFIFLLSVVTFSYEESLQEPCSSPIYVRIQDGIGQDCRAAEHVSQYTCPTLQSALEFGELQTSELQYNCERSTRNPLYSQASIHLSII